jgi:hypothetical protein
VNHWSPEHFEILVSEFANVISVRKPFPWTVVVATPSGALGEG